jgi:hypothetical protein
MNFLKKYLKWAFLFAMLVMAMLQFIQPAHTNPPVTNDFLAATAAPQNIAAMFHAACYDCHSNQTRWPWYSHLAPMSWQIAQDVSGGRGQMNLSEWPANDPKRAWKRMEDMSEEIDQQEMPLKKYTLIHADARLTADQRTALTQWLDGQVDALKAGAGAN